MNHRLQLERLKNWRLQRYGDSYNTKKWSINNKLAIKYEKIELSSITCIAQKN